MRSLILVGVIAGAVIGGSPQTRQAVEVRGVVFDAATDRPLRGASVQIGELYSSSDVDGRFAISDVMPGRQVLMVFRQDYLLAGLRRPLPGQPATYHDGGIRITIPPQDAFEMNVFMNLTPQISGTVIDGNGRPVEGVAVIAFRLGYDGSGERTFERVSSPSFSLTTDDRGEFVISGIPPGDYVFRVDNAFLQLSRRTIVPTYYPSSVDLSGAEVVTLRAGDDIRLRSLVLADTPLRWLTLKVVDEKGDEVGVPTLSIRRVGEVRGLGFRVSVGQRIQVTPGAYEIEAGDVQSDLTLGGTKARKIGRAVVEVRDSDVTLPLVVSEGARLTVRVLYDDGRGGRPVGGIPVRLIPRDFMSPLYRPFVAVSSTDGNVTFNGVATGSYRVDSPLYSETVEEPSPIDQSYTSDLQNVCVREILQGDTPVVGGELRMESSVSTATVVLKNATTRIQGNLGLSGGNAIVVLVPEDRREIAKYAATAADEDGNFQLKCALPGQYRFFAFAELSGAAYRNDAFMARYWSRGTPVRVGENEMVTAQMPVIHP